VPEIIQLFSLKELSALKEVGISGGEPYIRDDILEVFEAIFTTNKSFDTIYLTTNASFNDRVLESLPLINRYMDNVNLGVSIDGCENVNEIIRGVNNYHHAVELLSQVKSKYSNVKTSISMTINSINCNENDLNHIKKLAHELQCDYSFRLAVTNDSYYKNSTKSFEFTKDMKKTLIRFIIDNKLDDKFMAEQLYYLITNKVPLMYNYSNAELICKAGKSFVFIHSNGSIYPCINSTQKIGDYKTGINSFSNVHTSFCPCMTECTIWPMLMLSTEGE
jgi:MoaA/NifB/PqqE/SkfB family radical SAM enzyme